MKKTILAMAVPALLAAGAANASINLYADDGVTVDLSGAMEIQYYKDKAQNENGKLRVDDADLLVSTSVALSDSINALGAIGFKYEGSDSGIVGDSATVESDELWVGLGGDFGTLTFGRQVLISDDSGVTLDYESGNGWGVADAAGTQVIKYVYDGGMFYAGTSVNLDEDTTDNDFTVDGKNGFENDEQSKIWDGRVGVRVAGLDARVYYYDAKSVVVDGAQIDQQAWNLEGNYVIGDFLIAAAYGQIEDKPVAGGDKTDTDVVSLGVAYALNENVDFAVGYDWKEATTGATKVDADNVYANVTYGFHSNVKAYAEVGFYDDNKVNKSYDTQYLVGMEVKF